MEDKTGFLWLHQKWEHLELRLPLLWRLWLL